LGAQAALVESMDADSVTVQLVNVSATAPRNVVVQGGAYGEHACLSIRVDGAAEPVPLVEAGLGDSAAFTVRLRPGCAGRLTIQQARYQRRPSLAFPWDRKRMAQATTATAAAARL
jgi:hypothetical protein